MPGDSSHLDGRCLAKSTSKWNFLRTWYCSKPAGHSPATPHVARDEHLPFGDIVWLGPWEDGTYFDVPDGAGIEPWTPPSDDG